jgi:hypothetical protein
MATGVNYSISITSGTKNIAGGKIVRGLTVSGVFNPPDGVIGVNYFYATAFLFTGSAVDLFALSGDLPDGLIFNATTGNISGIPTTSQTMVGIAVTATNITNSIATNVADIAINATAQHILTTDFSNTAWFNDWGLTSTPGNTSLISSDPSLGFIALEGNALKVKFAQGAHEGASWSYQFADRGVVEPEEIYFRYYLRLANDWDPATSGKLPGISGTYWVAGWGGRQADGFNGWSARGLYQEQNAGKTQLSNYIYHVDQFDQWGTESDWLNNNVANLDNNRWYCIEQYIKLNTPTINDGIMRGWVDGVLAHERLDMRFRDTPALKIYSIWMDFYFGGEPVALSDHHLYIDDVVISNSYIGLKNEEPLSAPIASGIFNPPDGFIDVAYTYSTSGLFTGGAVDTYTLNGTLPAGLSLNTSTGVISGAPTTLQTLSNISITGTNIIDSATTNAANIFIDVAPVPGDGWTITADFESGNPGDNAQLPTTADAFHGTADDSKIVSSPVYSGSQAGSCSIVAGDQGFGRWGGAWNFPEQLGQGDEVRWRVRVFYPAGWTFAAGGEGMKFMRIHVRSSGGANEGYHSTLIKGGSTGGLINVNTEVDTTFWDNNPIWPENDPNSPRGLGTPAARDQWITYEMQIKFHSEANQGIYRVWQDGILIFEDLLTPTLRSASSTSDFVYFYTYWNGLVNPDDGSTATQTCYVDDVVITSSVPAAIDAAGNAFIGLL